MRIKKIELSGFKCYGDTSIAIPPEYNDILVIGENKLQTGMNSNESGKSSFVESILYAYFGVILEGSLDDIIGYGQEECFVAVEAGNMSVERKRKRGVSRVDLKLFIDGVRHGDDETKSEAIQKKIFEILGLPEDPARALRDYQNRVYFSPDVIDSFVSKNVGSQEKMNTVVRFLGVDKLIKVLKVLSENIRGTKKDIEGFKIKDRMLVESERNDAKSLIETLVPNINFKEKQIEDFKEIAKNTEKYFSLKSDRDSTKNDIDNLNIRKNDRLDLFKERYETVKSNLAGLKKLETEYMKLVRGNDIENRKRQITKEVRGLNDALEKTNNNIVNVSSSLMVEQSELSELSSTGFKCPDCDSSLMIVDGKLKKYDMLTIGKIKSELKENIKRLNDRKEKHSQDLIENKKVISKLEIELVSLGELDVNLAEMRGKINEIGYSEKELKKIVEDGTVARDEFDLKIESVEKIILSIEEDMSKIVYDDQVLERLSQYNFELTEKKTELATLRIKIQGLESDLKKIDKDESMVSDYKLKLKRDLSAKKLVESTSRRIVSNFSPLFQASVNKWLDLFEAGFEIEFKIDPTKIRDAFKILVIQDGKVFTYEQRSKGAKTRIAVSVGLAFMDLSEDSKIEFMKMDEVLDGLDSSGKELFLDLIDKVDAQKIIVTFDEKLQSRFDNVLRVVREKDGLSRLEWAA